MYGGRRGTCKQSFLLFEYFSTYFFYSCAARICDCLLAVPSTPHPYIIFTWIIQGGGKIRFSGILNFSKAWKPRKKAYLQGGEQVCFFKMRLRSEFELFHGVYGWHKNTILGSVGKNLLTNPGIFENTHFLYKNQRFKNEKSLILS